MSLAAEVKSYEELKLEERRKQQKIAERRAALNSAKIILSAAANGSVSFWNAASTNGTDLRWLSGVDGATLLELCAKAVRVGAEIEDFEDYLGK